PPYCAAPNCAGPHRLPTGRSSDLAGTSRFTVTGLLVPRHAASNTRGWIGSPAGANPVDGVTHRLDLAVLHLDQPGLLLQVHDDVVEDVGAGGVLRLDLVADTAHGLHRGVDVPGDQVHRFGGVHLISGELRQRGALGDGVGPAVGHRVERAHPFGDDIAGLAGVVDQFIELQVQVTEVGAHHVPVRLLTLQLQFDQLDQH